MTDDLVSQLGAMAKERLNGVLPAGFAIRHQKNGRWVGRWPNGEIKATDREYVEAWMFMVAAGYEDAP